MPWNIIGYIAFAALVMWGDKALPLLFQGVGKAYAGLKSVGLSKTTTKAEDALPSFSEAIAAMEVIAVYKAKCTSDPGFGMAMAALKTLEAS